MTSNLEPSNKAYVWIWLPGAIKPVVAGVVVGDGTSLTFNYGKSYLARSDAISIYDVELPLQAGALPLLNGLSMPGCLRDGAPDAWGRRVIINKLLGAKGRDVDTTRLDELTYMLESGSDRIGALDFQKSESTYKPRVANNATLEELLTSAERVEKGILLSPDLDRALHHGSSIGGARPKALIDDAGKKYVAKFSASSDLFSVVKAEFIAMRLAHLVGLHVAPVQLVRFSHKDVLLVERFDRTKASKGWQRHGLLSALTLLGLDEMMARYASYEALAEIIRHKFSDARVTLHELFSRLVFNILCGNTDDHARNHAALWDGQMLKLSPAYDICPQARSGNEASQAMLIHDDSRSSQIKTCISAAAVFHLSKEDAVALITQQIKVIGAHWEETCDQAQFTEADRRLFWGRQFLNPYAFEGLSKEGEHLAKLGSTFRPM